MANIKFDLKNTINDINGLNEATRMLQNTIQQLFGNLGQLLPTFGSQIESATKQTTITNPTATDMLTNKGKAATMDVLNAALKNRDDLESGVASRVGGNLYQINRTRHGVSFQRRTSAEDMIAAQGGSNGSGTGSFQAAVQAQTRVGVSPYAIGQSLANLPLAMKQQGSVEERVAALNKGMAGKDPNDPIVLAMKAVSERLQNIGVDFSKALNEFKQNPNDLQVEKELLEKMGRLTEAIEHDTEIKKQLPPGYSGGGGGGFGSGIADFLGKANPYLQVASRAGGAMFGAYMAYERTGLELGRATLGGNVFGAQIESQISQRRAQENFRQWDMTNSSNILEFRGDLLGGTNSRYLGTSGRQRAGQDATEFIIQKIRLENEQKKMGVLGGIAQIGGGIAGILSGNPVAALLGLGSIGSGAEGAISSQVGSRQTAYSGELNQGLIGVIGRMKYGKDWEGMAADQRRKVTAEIQNEWEQTRTDLIGSGLNMNSMPKAAVDEILGGIQARKRGAVLVGGYASANLGRMRLDQTMQSVTSTRNVPTSSEDAFDFAANIDDYGAFPSERRARRQGGTRSVTETNQVPNGWTSSPWSSLEMSATEFQGQRDLLTNALGPGSGTAGIGATANMIRLGRSGLGSFEQQLGNLSQLNSIAGGRDNTDKLVQILGQAVSIGFDKSRTAQQFVQTTAGLAETIKVQNVATVGRGLSLAASGLGFGGQADEASIRSAASGLSKYAAYTGDRAGLSGALNVMGSYQAGLSFGTGAGILSSKNATQLLGYTETLRNYRSGQTIDPNLESFLRTQNLDLKNKDDREKALKTIETVRRFQTGGVRAVFDQGTVENRSFRTLEQYTQELRGVTNLPKSQQAKARRDIMTKVRDQALEVGALSPLEGEGTYVGALQEFQAAGVIGENDYKRYADRSVKKGNAAFKDRAGINFRKKMDDVLQGFLSNDPLDVATYQKYLNDPTISADKIRVSKEIAKRSKGRLSEGQNIDQDLLKRYSDNEEVTGLIKEDLRKYSKLDLARSAQSSVTESQAEQAQKVIVTNWGQMATEFLITQNLATKKMPPTQSFNSPNIEGDK